MAIQGVLLAATALATTVLPAVAQAAPGGQAPADAAVAGQAARGLDAAAILQKTFALYAGARSYEADWAYTVEQGPRKHGASMTVRTGAPNRLYVRVVPSPQPKGMADADGVPEMLVVVDGRTAWFHSATDHVYYKVALPTDVRVSPLVFFPQVLAVEGARRAPDGEADGRRFYVLEAATPDGAVTRVEIDEATYHIRRMTSERQVAGQKVSSALTVTRELFDKDAPYSTFAFRAARGDREVPAPPDAPAIFGLPSKPADDRSGAPSSK